MPGARKELKLCEAKTVETSVDEPPEVELKELPPHLEYAFLEGDNKLPVIIAKDLKDEEKAALLKVLKSHKRAIAWKLSDIKGVSPEFCTHKILMEEDYEPSVQSQRRVNPKIHDVIKKEVEKLLDAGLIYPISDKPMVQPVTTVLPKKEPRKDHFPLPFMDQMLERLAGNEYYCFLDGFSGYFQIPIDPKDQEKTTFTCPYGTFAYRRMPFGLCNAPGTFQRCMMAIFHDMIEKMMEVFMMDDFSVFGLFLHELSHLENSLKRVKTPIRLRNGAVRGARKNKHFQPIHYAKQDYERGSNSITLATEKEYLPWCMPLRNSFIILSFQKHSGNTDHSAINTLLPRRMLRQDSCGDLNAPRIYMCSEKKKELKIVLADLFQDLENPRPSR
ncbi:reverse transcriptase domain-containing protein [Tanacetum coccineum]|uniref:Reverse transcriptase domain-containing protein n=1 Tax=Tanacetum coccineum TaxID=301880 RepID=A0ABQ5CY37_9ASTR